MLILLLAALRRPLQWLAALAARTGAGLAVLWLFSGVGHLVGVHLGVNLVNALVLGVLGAPGFGLLLMLTGRWPEPGRKSGLRRGRAEALPQAADKPSVRKSSQSSCGRSRRNKIKIRHFRGHAPRK